MKGRHFIDEKDLIEQWQKWVDSSEKVDSRVASDELVRCLYVVADHLLGHPKFVRYKQHDKDDMKQDAVLKMMKNLKNFKPEKGKLFSYLTTCCWTAFVTHLAKYYSEINKKRELLTQALHDAQDRNDIKQSEAMKELLRSLEECQKQQGKNQSGVLSEGGVF